MEIYEAVESIRHDFRNYDYASAVVSLAEFSESYVYIHYAKKDRDYLKKRFASYEFIFDRFAALEKNIFKCIKQEKGEQARCILFSIFYNEKKLLLKSVFKRL